MKSSLILSPKLLFSFILFFSIVRFHPTIFPGVLAVYWYDFVLVIVSFFWLFYVNESIKNEIKEVYVVSLILLPFLLIPSIFVEYKLLYTINLFKIMIYVLYILLFLSIIRRSKITVPEYIKILDIAFVCVFIIAVIQLMTPPIFGEIIHLLFGDNKLRSIWQGYPRIYSTFYNANWFGVYLLFMLTSWLNYYLYYDKSITWLTLRLFPLTILLFFSGSRTAFIICGLVFIAIFLTYRFSVIKLIKYTLSLSAILVILIAILNYVIIFMGLDQFMGRFDIFFLALTGDFTGDRSLLGRLSSQARALEFFMERPLFGYGDRPNNLIPHNSILTIVLSFGILGLFGIATFVGLLTARICLIKSKIKSVNFYKRCYLFFSIGLFVAMMAADFIYTSQVIFLWIISVSLILAHHKKYSGSILIVSKK